MGKRKLKSIYDNISLDGLESFYEQNETANLDLSQISADKVDEELERKKNSLTTLREKESSSCKQLSTEGLLNRLKLKSTRKAVSKFLENLPFELNEKPTTLFEKSSSKKENGKTKLREIVKIVVVQDDQKEDIAYLEDRSKTIIDVVPEEEKEESTTRFRHMEDELTSAYCKIDILNSKHQALLENIEELESNCREKDEEILWLKSQNDKVTATLHEFESSFWWKVRNWFSGS